MRWLQELLRRGPGKRTKAEQALVERIVYAYWREVGFPGTVAALALWERQLREAKEARDA